MILQGYPTLNGWPLALLMAVVAAGTGRMALAQATTGGALSTSNGSRSTSATVSMSGSPGAPVIFDDIILFTIQEPQGSFRPQERSQALSEKILRIAEDPFYSPDQIFVEPGENKITIIYREDPIFVVTAEDATQMGMTREDLASQVIQIVKAAITRYRKSRLPLDRNREKIIFIAVTLLFIGLLAGIYRIYRYQVARIKKQRHDRTRRQAGELPVYIARNISVKLRALRLCRKLVAVVLCAAYLKYVFITIPLTRGFALGILHYFFDPLEILWHGFLKNLNDFFFILVIVVLAFYLLKLLRWIMTMAAKGKVVLPGISREWALPLYRINRLLVVAAAIVMIYPYIPGSSTEAFKGISIFAGALFTLGASAMAGNFIGGLALIFMGAFRPGDYVRIGDKTGDVVETSFTLTQIRTPKNEIVSIPNAKVLAEGLVNYSTLARKDGLILHATVTMGYDIPWRKVHELLVQAALRTMHIASAPAPYVLQKSFNDFSITYEINARTQQASAMTYIYAELHQNIQDTFREAGVEIMSPHYAALRDGNASTVTDTDRSSDKGWAFSLHLEQAGSNTQTAPNNERKTP